MEPGWGSRGVVHCFRAVSEKKREERQETGMNSVFHTHTHTHTHTQTQRDRKWLTATWGRGLGGGLNPIVMSIHDRSIWLEARSIARSLARLSGGVPNEQFICCAVFQLGLPLLFHGLLQGRDFVRRWLDFKRLFWFHAVWHQNDHPN